MSENSILEDTQRTQGHEALRKNVAAGLALAGAVRSTLGPKGLDKLLVDNQGRTLVTNDGVTVLRTAKVEHPIAKMIISASETQEKSVSDGTTSTVILCAELLRNAWYLVSQGVHPSVVSRGYSMAENYAMSELHSLKLEAPSMEVVRTVLEGKLNAESRELLSKLAVEAADNIFDEASNKSDATRVKKLQLTGDSVSGTRLVSGLMVAKTCVHPEMNTNLSNGKILLIDGGIERESLTSDVKIKVESTGVLEAFRKQEISRLETIVEKINDNGIQLVVCRDGIDDEARESLYRKGILAYRRVEKND
ncbi:MAG TPA: thermosome subunit, partial [Candidatus Poseidoniales archaeon]